MRTIHFSDRWLLSYAPFFFFNDTATTEIYTLSLHDALPIYSMAGCSPVACQGSFAMATSNDRSEEHTSELQSHLNLVCRLLLEKKNSDILESSRSSTSHTLQ